MVEVFSFQSDLQILKTRKVRLLAWSDVKDHMYCCDLSLPLMACAESLCRNTMITSDPSIHPKCNHVVRSIFPDGAFGCTGDILRRHFSLCAAQVGRSKSALQGQQEKPWRLGGRGGYEKTHPAQVSADSYMGVSINGGTLKWMVYKGESC